MACYICEVLQISFIKLAKPTPIKKFDSRPARPITHTIYPTLTVQGHTKMLAPLLVTQLSQHPIILGKLWMRRHGIILNMSCDKLTFWPGHCKHSDIKKKMPVTSKKRIEKIALVPSLSKPIRDQEKTLVQKSTRIVSDFIFKIGMKEVPAGQDPLYTNSGVCRPKKKVNPGRKILKRKPDPNIKNKATPIRNSAKLLPHVLLNTCGYYCISKEAAEEPPLKYIMPQKQSKASSAASSSTSSLATLEAS